MNGWRTDRKIDKQLDGGRECSFRKISGCPRQSFYVDFTANLLRDIEQFAYFLEFSLCQNEDAFQLIIKSFPAQIICIPDILLGFCVAGRFQVKIHGYCAVSMFYTKPRFHGYTSQVSSKSLWMLFTA
jgi:hypothetical protein